MRNADNETNIRGEFNNRRQTDKPLRLAPFCDKKDKHEKGIICGRNSGDTIKLNIHPCSNILVAAKEY